MFDSPAPSASAADAAWERDTVRDRSLSNEALAREIADLAQDGRRIYGTVLGLLNRIRPEPSTATDGETAIEDLVARALCIARGQDPDEILFHQDGEPPEPCGPRWSLELPAARAAIAVMSPARRLDLDGLRLAVARTVIGPRKALPVTCRWNLEQLQAMQWDRATTQARNEAQGIADAIVDRHILPLLDLAPASPKTSS